ncbi:MAG: peptidase U32 family protein [Actinomycetota bacterium]|nr:peptidase U32 family protein [Actinomycetota bacterium]
MSLSIELVACLPNKKTFDGVDAGGLNSGLDYIFDGFYLGQPYCLKSQGNFIVNHDDLRAVVGALRGRGKKAYLTTPAIPKGKDLAMVRKAIAAAVDAGIDGVEAHDVGVFRILRNEFPQAAAHVGNFANVYNEKTAALYKGLGAARISPSNELTGEELAIVAGVEGVEFARAVHGPLPLGMAYACLLRRTGDSETVDPCRQQCAIEHFMELDGWRMRSVGTSVLMGEDYCLVEHLAGLLGAGVSTMRLETYFDSPERIIALGKIYRQALDDALAGRGAGAEHVEAVRALTTAGLCNGWHFGQSGREYVGAGESNV